MKKHFSIFALTLVVLAFVAVSCKKDGQGKFSPKSLEDFTGTVWTKDDNGIILNFLDWGTRIYNTNMEGKITVQHITRKDNVSFADGEIRIDGADNEFGGIGTTSKMLGKLDGESLHFFMCNDEWIPAAVESSVLHLRKGFNLSSLKFSDSYVPLGVDLGELYTPAGVKTHVIWAEWNLGASAEKEVGFFYAWGELEQKPTCSEENYIPTADYDELPAEMDAASVRLGGNWRMPTYDEFAALLNTRHDDNFAWSWEPGSVVSGWRIKRTAATPSYLHGNSIFLPCAGYVDDEGHSGWYGWYWTSTSHYAASLGTSEEVDDIAIQIEDAYYGQCIRPVYTPL